jgi:predicted esterase
MKKRAIVLMTCILAFFSFSSFGMQESAEEFSDYREMRTAFGKLFRQQKFREAVDLLERHLDKFPDQLMANCFNLAVTYGHMEEYEKGIQALKYALDRNVWFSIYSVRQEFWEPFKAYESFNELIERNEELRKKAQESAKPDFLVVTPTEYSTEKKYPLFLALHGGGGNMSTFQNIWKSEKIRTEFITAYLQSSQVIAMDGYSWTEDIELALREIKDAYEKIQGNYSINTDEVIIGGFSSGGVAALAVSLRKVIPVAGFIVHCPAKPECFTPMNVRDARENGLRGTIISTEYDPRVDVQKEMAEVMRTEGFQYQFVQMPDFGHWFPPDLDSKIDQAIDHIRNK